MMFLMAIGIVGAASAGGLFAASFILLTQPKIAPSPAAPTTAGVPTPHPDPPPEAAAQTPSPAQAAPTQSPAIPQRPPPAAPQSRALVDAGSPPPGLRSAAARFALAQGDTAFGDGEVRVARFYYEQAADAGEAEAVVRMGETFDPAFLSDGRLRRVRGDPAAARFWYRRALGLGAVEAAERLDRLGDEVIARNPRERVHRRHGWTSAPRRWTSAPRMTFPQVIDRLLHPFPRG